MLGNVLLLLLVAGFLLFCSAAARELSTGNECAPATYNCPPAFILSLIAVPVVGRRRAPTDERHRRKVHRQSGREMPTPKASGFTEDGARVPQQARTRHASYLRHAFVLFSAMPVGHSSTRSQLSAPTCEDSERQRPTQLRANTATGWTICRWETGRTH